jgi:hypothetical protein
LAKHLQQRDKSGDDNKSSSDEYDGDVSLYDAAELETLLLSRVFRVSYTSVKRANVY